MFLPPILLFSFSILITIIILKLFGHKYAMDLPDIRKQHVGKIPQIGGIVFGPVLLFIAWCLDLAPHWYIIGGSVSILLGTIDDNYHVPWKIKFIIQLTLAAYLSMIFWGRFEVISFFNLSFSFSQILVLVVFLFWFIGIYNAVNLLDGLDGLAGGFMFLICMGMSISGDNDFAKLNFILAMILLGFLIFNQRPAKLFMGDAGSLFLGFHVSVLPLLFIDNNQSLNLLNSTPFIFIASFLVADTTRVFFTRILNKKNPMTADTIHFHHLVIQNTGSHLSSIGTIYLLTVISVIFSVLSFTYQLSNNFMIGYLALLLIFILTPPIQTYVPIITRTIGPLYKWQNNLKDERFFIPRTLFVITLFVGLIISIYFNSILFFNWHHLISVITITISILFYRKDKMAIYFIQLMLVLLFSEMYWSIELGTISKIFTILLIVTFLTFMLEKRYGCSINQFSSLDLLVIFIIITGIIFSRLLIGFSSWYFLTIFALWFGTSFIALRTLFLIKEV
jgi:UDP-GlcNAc:undecaprenyl-phosphate GlcNAc-1-phosphate transferase